MVDIYLEELHACCKNKDEEIETPVIMMLIAPFLDILTKVGQEEIYINRIRDGFFSRFCEASNIGENKEQEDDKDEASNKVEFRKFNLKVLQKDIFEMASSSEDTTTRKRLYAIHKDIATATKVAFVDDKDLSGDVSINVSTTSKKKRKIGKEETKEPRRLIYTYL